VGIGGAVQTGEQFDSQFGARLVIEPQRTGNTAVIGFVMNSSYACRPTRTSQSARSFEDVSQ
jgi:hypothetical protein